MRRLHVLFEPRVSYFWLGAIGALGAGYYLPGLWAAALAFGIAVVAHLNYRSAVGVQSTLAWMSDHDQGLTVNAVRLRTGSWAPDVTYRPQVIAPADAVHVLDQAADRIREDWGLHR